MKHDFTALGVIACIVALATVFLTTRRRAKHVSETTPGGPYSLKITADDITCDNPKRVTERIRWEEIAEIRLVTTSEGPWHPDEWYLFIGKSGGCSVPSEAKGFELLWPELKRRFPGLDYEAIIKAGTSDDQKVLWKSPTHRESHNV